jgi:hypothetical protein
MKKEMVALAAAQYAPLHMGLYSALPHCLRKKSGEELAPSIATLLHVEEKLVAPSPHRCRRGGTCSLHCP